MATLSETTVTMGSSATSDVGVGPTYQIPKHLLSGPTCPYLEQHPGCPSLSVQNETPGLYPYQTLRDGEIRLLTIERNSTHEPLKLRLHHATLSPELQYEALSYCWNKSIADEESPIDPDTKVELALWQQNRKNRQLNGKPLATQWLKHSDIKYHPHAWYMYYQRGGAYPNKVVSLDGHYVEIGGELFVALKNLRKEDSDRVMWVDALCINQNDYSERAQQVRLMGDIYETASSVVVWLGELFSDVEEAPKALTKIARHLVPIWKAEQASEDGVSMRFKGGLFLAQTRSGVHWDALAKLLQRGWFERVWCIQEVVKAQDDNVVIKMGGIEMPWTFFAAVIATIRREDIDTYLWSNGECKGSMIVKTMMELIMRKKSGGYPLLKLLQMTRSYKSTMAVDKIYSLLGLAADADECGVEVDYTLDAVTVFTNFAKNHIKKQQSLDILYGCTARRGESALEVPSWTPDWTQPQWHVPFFEDRNFAATGDSEARWHFEGNDLVVSGTIIDTVAAVELKRPVPRNLEQVDKSKISAYKDIPPWRCAPSEVGWWKENGTAPWNSSHLSWFEKERELRREWIENAISVAFPDGECTAENMENLWRTFVCDHTDEGLRPPKEWGELFPDWIVDISGTNEEVEELYKEEFSKKVKLDFREESVVDIGPTAGSKQMRARIAFGNANARCYNRRFFRSEAGRFGWGVDGMAEGDKICIIRGMPVPFIMKEGPDKTYTIVGDAYLHGMMYGEGLKLGVEEVMLKIV